MRNLTGWWGTAATADRGEKPADTAFTVGRIYALRFGLPSVQVDLSPIWRGKKKGIKGSDRRPQSDLQSGRQRDEATLFLEDSPGYIYYPPAWSMGQNFSTRRKLNLEPNGEQPDERIAIDALWEAYGKWRLLPASEQSKLCQEVAAKEDFVSVAKLLVMPDSPLEAKGTWKEYLKLLRKHLQEPPGASKLDIDTTLHVVDESRLSGVALRYMMEASVGAAARAAGEGAASGSAGPSGAAAAAASGSAGPSRAAAAGAGGKQKGKKAEEEEEEEGEEGTAGSLYSGMRDRGDFLEVTLLVGQGTAATGGGCQQVFFTNVPNTKEGREYGMLLLDTVYFKVVRKLQYELREQLEGEFGFRLAMPPIKASIERLAKLDTQELLFTTLLPSWVQKVERAFQATEAPWARRRLETMVRYHADCMRKALKKEADFVETFVAEEYDDGFECQLCGIFRVVPPVNGIGLPRDGRTLMTCHRLPAIYRARGVRLNAFDSLGYKQTGLSAQTASQAVTSCGDRATRFGVCTAVDKCQLCKDRGGFFKLTPSSGASNHSVCWNCASHERKRKKAVGENQPRITQFAKKQKRQEVVEEEEEEEGQEEGQE